MLKRILLYTSLFSAAAVSCTKDAPLTGANKEFASVSFINANASGRTVDVFVDGQKKTVNTPVAANSIILGNYVGINSDANHAVTVRDATNTTLDYYIGTITGVPSNSYSFFVYDTLVAGKLKGVLLTANRTITSGSANSNIRFLNFSPKSPALDCWLVRIVGATRTDSVNISANTPYIGNATPNVATLSNYVSVRGNQLAGANGAGSAATTYAIKVTLAGTQTIATTATTTFVPNRNYTIYVRGIYPATALSLIADN